MKSMLSTPLMAVSSGPPTTSAITSALAPGYMAETETVGGAICGYCWMGSEKTAIVPAIEMMIEMTMASLVREMKRFEIIVRSRIGAALPGGHPLPFATLR